MFQPQHLLCATVTVSALHEAVECACNASDFTRDVLRTFQSLISVILCQTVVVLCSDIFRFVNMFTLCEEWLEPRLQATHYRAQKMLATWTLNQETFPEAVCFGSQTEEKPTQPPTPTSSHFYSDQKPTSGRFLADSHSNNNPMWRFQLGKICLWSALPWQHILEPGFMCPNGPNHLGTCLLKPGRLRPQPVFFAQSCHRTKVLRRLLRSLHWTEFNPGHSSSILPKSTVVKFALDHF